jgi:hypothetical protein
MTIGIIGGGALPYVREVFERIKLGGVPARELHAYPNVRVLRTVYSHCRWSDRHDVARPNKSAIRRISHNLLLFAHMGAHRDIIRPKLDYWAVVDARLGLGYASKLTKISPWCDHGRSF